MAMLFRTVRWFSASAAIKEQMAKHPILMYAKSTCPYCIYASSVFDELEVKYHKVLLDQTPDADSIAKALYELTHMATVPNIFINTQHVGGFTELIKGLSEGTVQELLQEAEIPFKEIELPK